MRGKLSGADIPRGCKHIARTASSRKPVHNHHPHISSAEGHWPDAIFYPIVIDGQISIVQIACERLPAVQAVVDRLSSR